MLSRRQTGLVPVRSAFDLALDRVFSDVFEGLPRWEVSPWTRSFPAVNAWEDDKSFHVEAELPGFEEKDIQVTVLGNELRLEGKRQETRDENSKLPLGTLNKRFNPENAPVKIFTIAYGEAADPAVLQSIAKAAQGTSVKGTADTIVQVYRDLSAFF